MMLEFIFKGENIHKTCPLVVLLGENQEDVVSRLPALNESEKNDLKRWFESEMYLSGKPQAETLLGSFRPVVIVSGYKLTDAQALAKAVQAVFDKICRFSMVEIVWPTQPDMTDDVFAQKLALALEYASYRFDKYQTKKKAEDFPALEGIYFSQVTKNPQWQKVTALANAVRYARDLGNEPSNVLTPEALALDIKRLEYLDVQVDLLDKTYITQNKLGLIEAVARGAVNNPYVVVMRWCGNPKHKDWNFGLVGKGVTFDSGGISIKTGEQLIGEKKDMCGAAAVIAAVKAAALQKLPINLVAVLPLVENMPSGKAYKPDDILTSYSGQTVEVVNTDAEGRLILADALWFIQEKYKVKTLVDLATLTGSTAYIFGGLYAGLLCNDAPLAQQIKDASTQTKDKVWELPLSSEIDERLNSEVADMKNIGKREADSTQAACFLQRYIQKGVRWAHIDIAGCEADNKGLATGFGVELLVKLFEKMCEKIRSMDD